MSGPRTLLVLLAAAALAAAPSASAHVGGKAQPSIAAGASGTGLERTLTVRLSDADGFDPVQGAQVTAQARMASPHVMQLTPWALPEVSPGVYQADVRFLMAADWDVAIDVSGDAVVGASSTLDVAIERGDAAASAGSGSTGPAGLTVLPTRIADELSQRDVVTMAILWIHGLASAGWIIGVVVMAVALSAGAGVLAPRFRARLAAWYRSWGAALHWGFIPLVVLTGVYNMLYVTPFPIAWKPSQLAALDDIPYGPLYEAILVVKLGLFAALLITGTQVYLRCTRPEAEPHVPSGPGPIKALVGTLGRAGVFYVACVPLILGAAVALRYVHVLSHVAEVARN